MTADTEALICIRVAHASLVVAGSQQRKCSYCRRAVWVAPTGLEALQLRPAMRVICTGCVPASMAEAGEDEVQFRPMNQAQLDELRHHR